MADVFSFQVTWHRTKASPPARASDFERELIQILLLDSRLIDNVRHVISEESIAHMGLRRVLQELYALHDAGQPALLEQVCARMDDRPFLAKKICYLYAEGLERSQHIDPSIWLQRLLQMRT